MWNDLFFDALWLFVESKLTAWLQERNSPINTAIAEAAATYHNPEEARIGLRNWVESPVWKGVIEALYKNPQDPVWPELTASFISGEIANPTADHPTAEHLARTFLSIL